MKRILCIRFPNWPIQRLRSARPELESRPLVLSRPVRGVDRVFACSHEAAAMGVVRRQPIAEVTSLAATICRPRRNWSGSAVVNGKDLAREPHAANLEMPTSAHSSLLVLPYDPEADHNALLLLAGCCERFSPLVGVDDAPNADSLLLDVTATARVLGGEAVLTQEAVDMLTRRRLQVRTAVADTPAGAWAVAHFHGAFLVQPSPILRIAPGKTPDALRLLPIESLRLPQRTVELLHELGVDLVGQLAALPREELSSRFGSELLRCWDRVTGAQPEPIRTGRTRPQFTAAWTAEQPVRRREIIHAAMDQVVERLSHDLRVAGQGAIRVECRFDCHPDANRNGNGPVSRPSDQDATNGSKAEATGLRFTVDLFRPTVDIQRLLGLMHLKLERESFAGSVVGMEVAALETGPVVHRQMPLFPGGNAASKDQPGSDALEQLVERLSSRVGRQAIVAICLLPDAQPERAWRGEPLIGRPRRRPMRKKPREACGNEPVSNSNERGSTSTSEVDSGGLFRAGAANLPPRPLMVLPRPVALPGVPAMHVPGSEPASSGEPVCPPARIHFDGDEHRLVRIWGPERIETGWWRGQWIARDYYRVETAAGRRLWLFQRLDTGRWFAHGAFD